MSDITPERPSGGVQEQRLSVSQIPSLIMVVDDDPNSLILISALIKSYGYEVIEAEDGGQAIGLLNEFCPKMIFMDLQMPIMDGCVATRHIRSMAHPYSSIPIIGLVAGASREDYKRCRAAGMDDFISKPFRLEDIQRRLGLIPAA
ncbi:MAG: response regulator [Chitinophagaceae bacterium]|nr:response regulator [Chitinophagaceae bacterium]